MATKLALTPKILTNGNSIIANSIRKRLSYLHAIQASGWKPAYWMKAGNTNPTTLLGMNLPGFTPMNVGASETLYLLTCSLDNTILSLMKKILLCTVWMLTYISGYAQTNDWVKTNAPYGGYAYLSNASNGRIYAQSSSQINEIYFSDNLGDTWDAIPNLPPLRENDIKDLINYFAGGARNLYYKDSLWQRSTDHGQSWAILDGMGGSFTRIAETQTGALIGWDTLSNKIYRSIDEGQSWLLAASMPVGDNFNITANFRNFPFGNLVAYGGNGNQYSIYLSHDDGQTWERELVDSKYRLEYISATGALFFLETALNFIYRQDSINQTLIKVSENDFSNFVTLPSGRILADGIFSKQHFSDNGGLNWTLSPNNQEIATLYELDPLPDGRVLGYISDAIVKSMNAGNSWSFSSSGIRGGIVVDAKFVSDSTYFVRTHMSIQKTVNAGFTWQVLAQDINFSNSSREEFDLIPGGGYIAIANKRVVYSATGDQNFIDVSPPTYSDYTGGRVDIHPDNGMVFLGFYDKLFRSANFGQSWTLLQNIQKTGDIVFLPSGRMVLSSSNAIYYSDDNGDSWTSVDDPFPHPVIGSGRIFLSPNGILFLFPNAFLQGGPTPLLRSDDQGESWHLAGNLPESQTPWDLVFSINSHMYLHQSDDVYLSVNEGLSWQTMPQTVTDIYVADIFIAITPGQKLYRQNNRYNCYLSSSLVTEGAYIEGHVRVDADADCSTPDAQEPLKNRIVKAKGEGYSYFTNTDPDGHYIFFVDTGAYQVSVQNPSGIWWAYCEDTLSVELPEFFMIDTADFAALPLSFCPLMTVNVSIPHLRRCFDNEVYVEYCNQGTEPADSAWVDIMLDPYLSLVNSAQPYEILDVNMIRFFVGDIPSGECGQFQLTVLVDCDSTVLGQTHCVLAHGFPDTLCTTIPDWSGANIEAMVTCQDSTLQFNLKNTGNAHSQTLDYIIFEDDIVLFSGQEDYDITEDLVIDVPANGKTWRIESEQEPGHPFSTLALAFAEGCGGFNSLGYINQFTVNGIQPSWHRMCVQNTGSYDPNDKQGFPTGTGDDHNIRPGQTIDYLIRFQNTGTDTAFSVEILDTLSAFLDPTNIRPGASSHPYTWNLSGQGVISFTFNNIMLPDSNVNEPRSHGFVQFSIAPYLDVPLGSVIENSAAIYFDFNEPVITNTTWHTIQKSPLTSSLQPEPKLASSGLEIWPNPFNERTNIHVEKKTSGNLLLKIYDSRGTLVTQKTAFGPDIELHAKDLPAGLYWAEVRDSQGKLMGNGKLVKE